MRLRALWTVIVGVGLVLSLGGSSPAAEPMREFLEGLRARQYFDWAILYLDQLQERSDLPADLRAIIPYERAMTLSESAKHSVSPETQQRQLDQAARIPRTVCEGQPEASAGGDGQQHASRLAAEQGARGHPAGQAADQQRQPRGISEQGPRANHAGPRRV